MRAHLVDFMKRPAVIAAVSVLILRGLTLSSRFLLSVLLARMLSPAEMGEYGLVTAVLAFALLAVGLEFYSYMYREMVPASPTRRAQIIGNQIALAAVTFVVVGFLAALAVWVGLFPSRLAPWFLLILVTEHISLEATRILIITSRPIRAYIGVFLRGGIWVYAITVLMFANPASRSLETVLVWWALGGVSSIGFAAISLFDLPWRELRNKRPDWTWIHGGLRTARPFMLTAAGALTITYVDRFMIDKFAGRETLGIYTFYSTISIGLLSLGASVSHQFLPKIIAAHMSGPKAFRTSLRTFFWSLFAAACGMIISCRPGHVADARFVRSLGICGKYLGFLFDAARSSVANSSGRSVLRPLCGPRRRQSAVLQSRICGRLYSAQHRPRSGPWHLRRGIIQLRRQWRSSLQPDVFHFSQNA